MFKTKITTTIVASDRLNNSRNGNPRYRIAFGDGEMRTSQSDAAWCYGFGNPGLRNGDTVTLTLSKAGYIEHMEPTSK